MTKQPWLKFYPADWRSEPSLRICSAGARGLWIDMLCLMHDAEPRGSLVVGGHAVSVDQLASVTGLPIKVTQSLFKELERNRVFSRDEDGTIYSRRMRRDIAKAERDKTNGKGGGNPNLKRGVNPPIRPEDKAQKLEAEAEAEADSGARDVAFRRFVAAYPLDVQSDGVREQLDARLDEGVPIEEIVDGAKRYAIEKAGVESKYISSPVKWLKEGRWRDHQSKRSAEVAISRTTFIAVDDPIWASLAERYFRENGKKPPKINNGWHFPNEWIQEIRECVS